MLDDSGNLVGVGNTQEQKLSENQNVTSDDIQKELFEGENVITGKTDNGRSLLKSDPFTNSN
jgi:hypothetical protein